jgi:hypothetical protein
VLFKSFSVDFKWLVRLNYSQFNCTEEYENETNVSSSKMWKSQGEVNKREEERELKEHTLKD